MVRWAEKETSSLTPMEEYELSLVRLSYYNGQISRMAIEKEHGEEPDEVVLSYYMKSLFEETSRFLFIKEELGFDGALSFMDNALFKNGIRLENNQLSYPDEESVRELIYPWYYGFPETSNHVQFEVANLLSGFLAKENIREVEMAYRMAGVPLPEKYQQFQSRSWDCWEEYRAALVNFTHENGCFCRLTQDLEEEKEVDEVLYGYFLKRLRISRIRLLEAKSYLEIKDGLSFMGDAVFSDSVRLKNGLLTFSDEQSVIQLVMPYYEEQITAENHKKVETAYLLAGYISHPTEYDIQVAYEEASLPIPQYHKGQSEKQKRRKKQWKKFFFKTVPTTSVS